MSLAEDLLEILKRYKLKVTYRFWFTGAKKEKKHGYVVKKPVLQTGRKEG